MTNANILYKILFAKRNIDARKASRGKEAEMTERVDIAIIGTGPAGISAALTASNRNKSILLLGNSGMSEKIVKAHEIRNYPGLPAVKGTELAAAFRKHLDSMGIRITEGRVGAIYAMGDYFALQIGEEMREAKAVILATGVVHTDPLPGERELLGHGVSYCATCDAPLYRGKAAAVIGYSPREEQEAAFLNEVCEEVTYFPVYAEEVHLPEKIRVIREKVTAIIQEGGKRVVRTKDGVYAADGVFVLRDAVAPDTLVPGLQTEGVHVKVNRKMETNLPGIFAAGDLTGLPYQYVKAAGEGNVAAVSAAAYLDIKNKEV